MSDLEYLFEYIKQCHDAKDIAEMKDIVCDLEQLEQFYQQGNQNAIVQLVQRVVAKHQSEADEHDKGQPPAQNIHQLVSACRHFLVELGREKIEKKAREKLAEEALKHLGGN